MERSIEQVGAFVSPIDTVAPAAEVAQADRLVVHPQRVGLALGAAVVALVAMSVVTQMTGVADRIFMLDSEQNVPTYFSTLILVAAAALLAVIGAFKRRARDGYAFHWMALSAVFLYLSMDELIGFHEMTQPRVAAVVETSGLFYYGSTLVTGSLVILFGFSFLRFFLRLPRQYAVLFAASAGLYVGGALGMELIGGMVDESMGTENSTYLLVTTVEETAEMAGVSLFIYALLRYIGGVLGDARVEVAPR